MYQGLRGPMGQCATQILGLPISAEYSVTVGGGSVVRQDFERGSLIWDERQAEPWKCYFSAVGKQAQEIEQQVKSLQAQLATTNQQLQQATAKLASTQSTPAPASSAPSADAVAHAVVDLLGQTLLKSAAEASTR
jgi:hypothetical protein